MTNKHSHSRRFFDTQFQRQVAQGDYALNPFEAAILPYLFGDVLDLGCGLGNLALAAAARGCRVTALDASATAIEDLSRRSRELGLQLEARQADLQHYDTDARYDCVVSIGLLMFFPQAAAQSGLHALGDWVQPGGIAAVNVLIEGTTFLDMFEPSGHYLFQTDEICRAFPGWKQEYAQIDTFPAPGDTLKRFQTVVMRRPSN